MHLRRYVVVVSNDRLHSDCISELPLVAYHIDDPHSNELNVGNVLQHNVSSSEISHLNTSSENYLSQTNDPLIVKTKSYLIETEQPPTRNNFDFKHRCFHIAYMGCRFTFYSLFMDIQNSFLDIHNSFLDIQK